MNQPTSNKAAVRAKYPNARCGKSIDAQGHKGQAIYGCPSDTGIAYTTTGSLTPREAWARAATVLKEAR